jgi:hypothetical protein
MARAFAFLAPSSHAFAANMGATATFPSNPISYSGGNLLDNLFTMSFYMPGLVDIRRFPKGNEPDNPKTSFGRRRRANSLKVVGPSSTISATEGAKMNLKLEVRSHHMCGMDFRPAKHVMAVTSIGAEKFNAREAGSDTSHAP